jgi:MarR family transcriptional regulator, temperature-dependent positive regulator of motility
MTLSSQLPARIDLGAMPGHIVRRLHQQQFALFARAIGTLDLSPPQFAALAWLHNEGEVDQATLARGIAFDAVTIGGVLSRLEAKAWIERRAHPSDRRAKLVRINDREVWLRLSGDLLSALDAFGNAN